MNTNSRAALLALDMGTRSAPTPKDMQAIIDQIDELDDDHVHGAILYLVQKTYMPEHPYVTQVLSFYEVDVPYNRILDGETDEEEE